MMYEEICGTIFRGPDEWLSFEQLTLFRHRIMARCHHSRVKHRMVLKMWEEPEMSEISDLPELDFAFQQDLAFTGFHQDVVQGPREKSAIPAEFIFKNPKSGKYVIS
jgi:hypothetical protein